MVESGTGSGSMSSGIARAIMPNGHLYTYEFNSVRAGTATEEFNTLGLGTIVRCEHRDVVANGFVNPDLGPGAADAIFLDLPNPWMVADFAYNILNESNGKICSFSPCIEQVSRMTQAMEQSGFSYIRTFETHDKPIFTRKVYMERIGGDRVEGVRVEGVQGKERIHTGFLTFGVK